MTNKKLAESVHVCCACARTLRAHNRLTKLESPSEFVCFSGRSAANRGHRGMGSFQCLSGKVKYLRSVFVDQVILLAS